MSEMQPKKPSKKLKEVKKTAEVTEKPFKSTNAEVNQRVAEIQDLILQGYTRSHILQYGSKWKVSDRQIDDYLGQAKMALKEINQATIGDNQAIIINGLWGLFRAARADGNIAEQHKILMSIAKLKGLEQQTINHVIEDKRQLQDLSDSELDAILEQDVFQ